MRKGKEMFYLTTHSTRFIYSYMVLVTDKINDMMILIYLYIKRETERERLIEID